MMIPVSACIITKNDPLIFDAIKSIRDYVNEIVVVDTGSTEEYQDQVRPLVNIFDIYTDCSDPQTGLIDNFAQARQRSFDLSAENNWIFWLDGDDILDGLEHLQKLIAYGESIKHQFDALAFMFPYEYAYDNNGQCILRHYRERLISNRQYFRWVNPVHEVLIKYPDNANINFIQDDSIIWKHKRQFSPKPAEPGRNLRILKKYIEGKGKDDARQHYYIGLEYANNGFIEEAIQSLSDYCAKSGWDDEIVMACLKLVDIYIAKNQLQDALQWGFKAIETCETWSEGYLALGKIFYLLAQQGGPNQIRYWQRCAHFIKMGLSMPPTKTLLFVNPMEREHEIHKYLNVALNNIGDVRGALDSCNTGLKKKDDPMLAGNKKLYEKFLINNQIIGSLNQLKEMNELQPEAYDLMLDLINNKVNAKDLLQPKVVDLSKIDMVPCGLNWVPELIKQEESNKEKKREINSSICAGGGKERLDIVIGTFAAVELWNPDVAKQGLGGSEQMACEIAKRLVKLGHRVRVYNDCRHTEGIYDGVEYIRYERYQDLTCDVLIVSRRADMVDDQFNIQAKLKLLWVHDIFALASNNRLLLKFDRILALSKFHKDFLVDYHNISPESVIQTHNGIDLSRFEKNIARDQYKCICASSPDRYLPVLLSSVWPRIKARVPKASLTIAYGFKNWLYAAQNDPPQMDLIKRLQQQLHDMKAMDVKFIDRARQDQLAEEYLSSGVLLYPTFFTESSYIGGMECQAAGVRFVGSAIGAINETVGDRGCLISGQWTDISYQNEFVDQGVKALLWEDNSDRKLLQEYAKEHFCLDKLAKEWEDMFFNLKEELKYNPITNYFPTRPYR